MLYHCYLLFFTEYNIYSLNEVQIELYILNDKLSCNKSNHSNKVGIVSLTNGMRIDVYV